MNRRVARPALFFALATAVLLALVALSLALGATVVDPLEALSDPSSTARLVVLHERLPRTALAVLVGAALAVSGLAFQSILANPLADPYVIGVAGGAAIGGTIAILVPGVAAQGSLAVSGGAFVTGLLSILLTWRLSLDRTGRMRAYEVLLVGVVFNAFASAVIMYLKAVVRAEKAQEMLLWLMGTLSSDVRSPGALLGTAALVAIGSAVLWRIAPALNALALGDEDAARLGVNPAAVTRIVFVAGSLLVAASVAVAGLIGFVGLIVPHAVRALAGPDHRIAVPGSLLVGAAFLVAADLCTRLLFPVFGTEAPIGVLTALVGAPAFVWLLKRGGRS